MSRENKHSQKLYCNICTRNIRGNAKAVCCDFCDRWVHSKCNSISTSKYDELSEEDNDEQFLCIKCFNDELPFGFQNDTSFNQAVTLGLKSPNLNDVKFNISKTEKKTISFLNKTIFESNDPNIKRSYCKYYSIDDFCKKNMT